MASTGLTRTPSSTGNRKTWTLSVWLKRSNIGSRQYILRQISGGDYLDFQFQSNDTIQIFSYSGSTLLHLDTNRVFRDINAWYHFLIECDTTQATASNRCKFYINGVQETSFSTETYPSQNTDLPFNNTNPIYIGTATSSLYFDGIMSHFHFTDGTAYDASAFGSTDSTTNEWKINTSPSVTYGTNGFFILKDGNSVTDQSDNSNNFTVAAGTLTKTEDCPSNVFATWNALDNYYASATLTNGNTKVATNNSAYSATLTSLGVSSGKYYAEFKLIDKGSGYCQIGIKGKQPTASSDGVGAGSDGLAYQRNGNKLLNGSSSSYGTSYDNNDIIGIAMDLDNNRLFFSKNGTFQNSGDPTSSTGAITIPTSSSSFYFMGISDEHNAGSNTWEANFGNGYFGTTAVSSAGTNASGIGIFEYDVPTGYTALSTKGLNE